MFRFEGPKYNEMIVRYESNYLLEVMNTLNDLRKLFFTNTHQLVEVLNRVTFYDILALRNNKA